MNTQGTVESVDGKFVVVNGEKYSAFAPTQIHVSVGDYVNFEYTEKNGVTKFGTPVVYKNIKGNLYPAKGVVASPTGMAPTPTAGRYTPTPSKIGEPILSKDRLILRQNALTAAVNFVNTRCAVATALASPEDVIVVAKIFEGYTSGDDDLKSVEKELDSSTEC